MKTVPVALALVLMLTMAAGCPPRPAEEKEDLLQPVTIENFNRTTTFTKVPERVVVLTYDIAEVMTALGLENKIVALAPADNTIEDVLPEYRDRIKDIPLFEGLKGGVPSLESVLKVNPDFVYGVSFSFDPRNVGSAEDFEKAGVNIYVTEGTYVDAPTLENLYNDILNIGKIFRVEERANELIADFRERVDSIKAKVPPGDPVKVFVYDFGTDIPFTIGGKAYANYLINIVGGKNIFDDISKQFTRVSWEDVIHRKPEVIIVTKWTAADDAQKKIDFLKGRKELSGIPAIKNNRFIVVSLMSIFPGMQNINALQTIKEGLWEN